jgi:hypothetical protein
MRADFDPLTSGDDRERRQSGISDPHFVLELGHVFSATAFSENDQGSMNLASKTAPLLSKPQRTSA